MFVLCARAGPSPTFKTRHDLFTFFSRTSIPAVIGGQTPLATAAFRTSSSLVTPLDRISSMTAWSFGFSAFT